MANKILPTIQAISDLLFIPANPDKAELIFVFGSSYLETMRAVKELYDKKYAKRILISGNSKTGLKENEAERFYNKGLRLEIPKECFLLEKKSTNTKENIIFSKKIIEKEIGFANINTIIFVCKAFHTRRVLMTAKNFFPKNINFRFYPVIDKRNITKNNWWQNEDKKFRVMDELRRIFEYTIKGDLSLK